jgi:hypothetical protein
MKSVAEIVDNFLVGLGAAIAAVQNHFLSVSRSEPTKPLMGWTIDDEHRKRGTIPGVGDFLFHGFGCRIEFDEGQLIDFDWSADGEVTFDGWRVKQYADSVGDRGRSVADFTACLEDRAASGELSAVGDGWFKQ